MTMREVVEDSSKEKLKEVAQSKFTTTTVGAIAAIEKTFGDLWGLDTSSELTKEQADMKQRFDRARAKIMNLGNDQRRNFVSELDSYYDVKWKVHHYEFKVE